MLRSYSPLCVSTPQRLRDDAAEIERRLGAAAVPVRAFALLCQYNSDERRQDEALANLTGYHSTEEPSISLAAYAERVARKGSTSIEGILIGLRLAGRCREVSGITLTRLSAHRLLLTGVTIGLKCVCDTFRTNRVMASAGCIESAELGRLEWAMFRDVGFRAVVTHAELLFMQRFAAAAVKAFARGDADEGCRLAELAFCTAPPAELPSGLRSLTPSSCSPATLSLHSAGEAAAVVGLGLGLERRELSDDAGRTPVHDLLDCASEPSPWHAPSSAASLAPPSPLAAPVSTAHDRMLVALAAAPPSADAQCAFRRLRQALRDSGVVMDVSMSSRG